MTRRSGVSVSAGILAVLLVLVVTPQPSGAQVPACAETMAVRREAPRQVGADALGTGPWFINEDATIWALKQPWRPGTSLKTAWIKPVRSTLHVTGRRLDAAAPPLQVTIPRGYAGGFQASGVMFPTVGCWEVTATAGRSTLRFVTAISAN